MIEWKPRRKYCIDCAREKHNENHKRYVKEKGRIPKKSYGGKVVCKCPTCGRLHKIKMEWTGKGMPRKYCDGCLTNV